MKTLLALLTLGLLISCQRSNSPETGEIKSINSQDLVNRSSSKKQDDGLKSIKKIEEVKEEKVIKSFEKPELMLVAHSKFAFIEAADVSVEELEELKELTDKYPGETSICRVFEMKNDKMMARYDELIGDKLHLHNNNRNTYDVKVKDIVLVNDQWSEEVYVAAVLDGDFEGDWIYYAWATEIGETTYPFRHVETNPEVEIEGDMMEDFASTVEYSQFEEVFEIDDYAYPEMSTVKFQHFNGEIYHVIQYNAVGECASIIENLTAVYSEVNGHYEMIALGRIPFYFTDLIDTNGDGIPELLTADFSASAIYSISNKKLQLIQEMNWSTEGCPC